MTPLESRCLESFPAWLRSLPEDASALAVLLEGNGSDLGRGAAAVALTYLVKSLDLIPDGLEDLGFIDDAFVLRVAAARVGAAERGTDPSGTLARLAKDAELIAEFLGPEYAQLEAYVERLQEASARGRSVADILTDEESRIAFVGEVRRWASDYSEPTFLRDQKNLVKLRSFLTTRLAG